MADPERQGGDVPAKEGLATPGEPREQLGEIAVVSRKTGPRIAWSSDHTELRVNTGLFPSENQARAATLGHVAGHIGLTEALRADAQLLLEATRKHPEASSAVLRLQGLARLRESNAGIQPAVAENQTLAQEFQWALDTYALTGKYPEVLADEVQGAIARIPKPKRRSLVDYISSGRYLEFDGQNFTTHIQPLIDELSLADRQTGQSEKFEYRPFQTQDVAGSEEPLEESDVTVCVTPFYGGYYREQVCRYDPATKQIVKEGGAKATWALDDAPDTEAVWKTRRTYQGLIQDGQETLLKLPYNALPLNTTLTAPTGMQFMRDELGIVSIDPKQRGQVTPDGKFSFDFVLTETQSNQLNTSPTEQDSRPAGGNLDPETQTLLDELSTQNWMSDVQKAREITLYVRRKLRYPEDKAEIGQIDSLYLSSGHDLWTKIAETGVAHCYWANIFRDELCKRLGIASRIATGPYVGGKDPRFEFAAVEAPGLDKHAWGEVWDPAKEVWTHRGMDATPAKAKDESQDSQDDQTEPLDGDFGESLVEQPELSQEEIERLYQELTEQDSSDTPTEPTPEERAAQQFQEEKGVSLQEWHRLESWINGVNKTPVPPESSIRHRPSTIYQEWRDLFDLLYKRREIPYEAYKGPVRQSEGDILDDPVTAYIDVRSQEDDPLGYQRPHEKQRERVEVSVFDDDFLLDISGSMSGTPAEEQRKMVLSSEYNIKNLNDRLGHSNYRDRMTTPLTVNSRVAVFGNWTETVQESTDAITEKGLCELDAKLGAQNQSSVGLHASLTKYRESLTPDMLQQIRAGKFTKVLTVVSDGDVAEQDKCITDVKDLRALGVIVQGIGFGSGAQDIKVVCHDPTDADAAVVIDDVTQATLVRHKLLMKHLSNL